MGSQSCESMPRGTPIANVPDDSDVAGLDFVITLNRQTRDKLGLEVIRTTRGVLKVKMVRDGLVNDWNRSNPGQVVSPGDYIVDVDGIAGDNNAMFAALSR